MQAFDALLKVLPDAARTHLGFELKVAAVMADKCDQARTASAAIWAERLWLTCFSHMGRYCMENSGSLPLLKDKNYVDTISDYIWLLHLSPTREQFDALAPLVRDAVADAGEPEYAGWWWCAQPC